MILFLKLLVFPLVLTNFQRLIVEGGYITWEVMDVPVVFGDNVTIRCTYHNRLSCTDHVFWTWTTGKENELIMTNGTLSEKYKNGKKYSERRSSCTQHSILVISNLSEIDYKKKYKCGIVKINSPENSFVQYPKEEITFENISYEYLTTESNLVDISPVEDLTTESNLFVSTVEDLTTERNFVDISLLKGFYLAAIIFVGVFYTLYPVSVMVVMIRLYYASKDQFDKIKQILSRIDKISYVCIGSCLMFGVLSLGGLNIQVRHELPIQVEYGLNVFSIIVMVCPCLCCIPIFSVKLFAERKLPKKTWCSKFGIVLWQIFFISFFMLSMLIMYFISDKTIVISTIVLNRTYSTVFFFWMPMLEQATLFLFLFSKDTCMSSIEKLHKTRDRRLHRNTELVVLKDPNGQGDEEMDTDV